MEMDQDRIRDTDHVFDNEPPAYQQPELEPPMTQEMEQQQNVIENEPVELPGQGIEPPQHQQGSGSAG